VKGNEVELSQDDQERILHYLLSYGTGGWQDRLAGVAGLSRSSRKRQKPSVRRPRQSATR
jgi:hypothetical protein